MCSPHRRLRGWQATLRAYRERGELALLTNCLVQHPREVRSIVPRVLQLLPPPLVDAARGPEPRALRLMCIGMPNVGKSSLLNALRRTLAKKGAVVRCWARGPCPRPFADQAAQEIARGSATSPGSRARCRRMLS